MAQPEMRTDAPSTAAPEGERDHGFAFYNEVRKLTDAEQRGDLAELRRLDPDQPGAPAFFRILARTSVRGKAGS